MFTGSKCPLSWNYFLDFDYDVPHHYSQSRENHKQRFKVRNNGHLIQYGFDSSNVLELRKNGQSRGTFQLDRPGIINVRSTKILNVRVSNRTDNFNNLSLYAGFMKKANHPDDEIKIDSGS